MKASFVQNRISVSFLELVNMVNMVCRVKRQVDMLLMQKSMTVSARMEEPEEAIFLQVHWGCEALEGDFRDVRLNIDESPKMQPNLLHSTS